MRKVLVTGAEGFVGKHLCLALDREGANGAFEVVKGMRKLANGQAGVVELNFEFAEAIDRTIQSVRPDAIVHLAAISTSYSRDASNDRIWSVNFEGTRALAKAMRRHVPGSTLIYASSAEVYGTAMSDGLAKKEVDPVCPQSVYAKSKLASELMLEATLADVCDVVALRLFNHVGPGQDERFVLPAFAAQIARIEREQLEPVIKVGNLAAKRDFLAVSDVIDVYRGLLRQSDRGAGFHLFNVSSGAAHEIRQFLDRMIAMSSATISVEIDPNRLRDINIPVSCGDSSKIRNAIGWAPRMDLDQTLLEIMTYWRETVERDVGN